MNPDNLPQVTKDLEKAFQEKVIELTNILRALTHDFTIKKMKEEDRFCPIEWTGVTLSGYVNAILQDLNAMGNLVKANEHHDKYNEKVGKFEEKIIEIIQEMSDLKECFNKMH